MRTYIYNFNGHFLEGFMLINAKNRKDADTMFKQELPESLHEKNIHSNGRVSKDAVTVDEILYKNGRYAHMVFDGNY